MMMRRYRFVEEDLTIGKPETEHVVAQTRRNVKLWSRVDETEKRGVQTRSARYTDAISRSSNLMFPGCATCCKAPPTDIATVAVTALPTVPRDLVDSVASNCATAAEKSGESTSKLFQLAP